MRNLPGDGDLEGSPLPAATARHSISTNPHCAHVLSWHVRDLHVRPIPPAATRALRQVVLRPDQTIDELAVCEPSDLFAVGAFAREELVAVGLVGPEGGPGEWRVRDVAASPQARGCGAGTLLLDALVRHAAAHGATAVWCNARTHARSFYERAGFTVASAEFELPGMGPRVRMELKTMPIAGGAS